MSITRLALHKPLLALTHRLSCRPVHRAAPGFVGILFILPLLFGASSSTVLAQSDAERISNAVHAVRAELEAALGKTLPSVNIYVQTPGATFFASSAASPELALTPDTNIRFASNTKHFTATAILLLQQMGLLNITNRIVDSIPGTGIPFIDDGPEWAIPFKERITILQLLRHSAGVYDVDNSPVPGCDGGAYTEWMLGQNASHQFSAAELVGQVAQHQLSYFEPDEGYNYSNTGYTLLAEIVARVYSHYAGEPKTLTDFLYEMNLAGTDIRFPTLATDTALPEPYATGITYLPDGDPIIVSNLNMSANVGEGNGYGTMAALNRHIRTTMRGEGVLNQDSLHLMKTSGSVHQAVYGLGTLFKQDIGFGHTGAIMGHLSMSAYNPENEVSMVVYIPMTDFSNYMDSFLVGYQGMYDVAFSVLDEFGYSQTPRLNESTSTNLFLAAGETNQFDFIGRHGVYYGVYISGATADVQISIAPGTDPTATQSLTNRAGWSAPATATYLLSVTSTSATPATLRIYTLTNTIANLSSMITNVMDQEGLVGMGFALVDGDHVVWQSGYGYADRERGIPADENTVFMIGSLSKTFGALAAMQLVEEGLLDIDAPLTNALPSFSIEQRFPGNIITPRTILTHHSGLPGDLFNRGFTYVPDYDAPGFVQGLVAEETTLMPTNTFLSYNNSGFLLLGQMFRHLTGEELPAFARARLFDRIGMSHSSIVNDLPYIEERLARPYVFGELYPDEYINLFFAGSIYSTPADMARYVRMLLNGGMGDHARVVSNATLNAMASLQNADIPLDRLNSVLNMGIGFVLDPPHLAYMGKVLWHDGGTVYYRSLLRAAVDAGLGFFITCNSAEGGGANYAIADQALQWAFEEKTGIAPPPPVAPDESPIVPAPPGIIALATNSLFVTGDGFYRFEADGDGLMIHANAHTGAGPSIPVVYRESGWFTHSNSLAAQFLFTQVIGRTVCVFRDYYGDVPVSAILGESAPEVIGFDPAWSNRQGRWWTTNMHPNDISWLHDETKLTVPVIELAAKDDVLLLGADTVYTMAATNSETAFAAGLGRNKGSILRARPDGSLSFLGVHYRSEESIPALLAGTSTNGITTGDEIHWFRAEAAPGQPLIVDLDTTADITAYIFASDTTSILGQANRSHAFELRAEESKDLFIAVVSNGEYPGAWRLATHTGTIPFYVQLDPVDWPAQLIESSGRYPNTDFGHVFVRENRADPTAHILKIAVARMRSTSPGARPLLFLNGGPGDSGIRSAYQYFLQGFLDTHDVYLIDPRGVNLSQPGFAFAGEEELDEFQYRLRMIQRADLSAIHTVELAADIEDIVAAFGIIEADLIGQSYGTYLAQEIMRTNPGWLRAVVLDGVVAPNIPGLSQTGPVRDLALNAFFTDLASDPLYRDFSGTFYRLAEDLQDTPANITVNDETIPLDGLGFLNAVLNQLTSTSLGSRERIPEIVWRAARGESAALAGLFEFPKDTNVIFNTAHDAVQQMLIIKHDMLPFDSVEAAEEACAGLHPLLAELSIGFLREAAGAAAMFDDYGQANPSITNPVVPSIPTLVINGDYDTQTGPNWAAEVASHLPNAYFVMPPAVGHGVLFDTNGCTLQILRDFLANPDAEPDTACMNGLVPDFPPPWPDDAPGLLVDAPVTNVLATGATAWFRFASVSGLVYNVSPGGANLHIINGGDELSSASGAPVDWLAGEGDAYLWLLSGEGGSHVVEVNVPTLLRNITANEGHYMLTWQAPTGSLNVVESATRLDVDQPFSAGSEEPLSSSEWFRQQTIPAGEDAMKFFRIAGPASSGGE